MVRHQRFENLYKIEFLLKLNFFSRMFCFREIFNTGSMFPSLLLHILDSDRAKWFMICKICNMYCFSKITSKNSVFIFDTSAVCWYNQHEKYVISYCYVLVGKFWFFCFFAVFLVLRCCSREELTNCFKLNTTQEFCLFSTAGALVVITV